MNSDQTPWGAVKRHTSPCSIFFDHRRGSLPTEQVSAVSRRLDGNTSSQSDQSGIGLIELRGKEIQSDLRRIRIVENQSVFFHSPDIHGRSLKQRDKYFTEKLFRMKKDAHGTQPLSGGRHDRIFGIGRRKALHGAENITQHRLAG